MAAMGCQCQRVRDELQLLRRGIAMARQQWAHTSDHESMEKALQWAVDKLLQLQRRVLCTVHQVGPGTASHTSVATDIIPDSRRVQRNNDAMATMISQALAVACPGHPRSLGRVRTNPLYELQIH